MAFKAFTSIPASQITVPIWPSRTPLLSTYYFPSFFFGPVFGGKDSDSILLHSVSKTQMSSTRFSVLLTCIYLCFLKGPALCRIKEMNNPMKPRETILYKNWKKNKSVFHKREGKSRGFQCYWVSITDREPLIEMVSAALFLQASPDSQDDGERRQKSSDYLLWSLWPSVFPRSRRERELECFSNINAPKTLDACSFKFQRDQRNSNQSRWLQWLASAQCLQLQKEVYHCHRGTEKQLPSDNKLRQTNLQPKPMAKTNKQEGCQWHITSYQFGIPVGNIVTTWTKKQWSKERTQSLIHEGDLSLRGTQKLLLLHPEG